MKKNKIVIASILALVGSSAMAQSSEKANFDTTAKIESFCTIQANDVNFGVVALPLTAQSANAQMRVLCSNNTPYKVDMHYGQYVPGESSASGYNLKYAAYDPNGRRYDIYNNENTNVGYLFCGVSFFKDKIYVSSMELAKLYGYSTYNSWQPDTESTCNADGTPTGWVGAYNAPGKQPVGRYTTSEFGSMSGTQKGDKLAYKVTLPDDSTKTWTKGLNAYSSTGIGTEQMININAQIVPDKSSSKYVAQDVYLDTVTAEVTY